MNNSSVRNIASTRWISGTQGVWNWMKSHDPQIVRPALYQWVIMAIEKLCKKYKSHLLIYLWKKWFGLGIGYQMKFQSRDGHHPPKTLPECACFTVEMIIDIKVSNVSITTSNFPWPQNFCHMTSFKSIKCSLRLACIAADPIPYPLSRGVLSTPNIRGLNSWSPYVRGLKSAYCFTISFYI